MSVHAGFVAVSVEVSCWVGLSVVRWLWRRIIVAHEPHTTVPTPAMLGLYTHLILIPEKQTEIVMIRMSSKLTKSLKYTRGKYHIPTLETRARVLYTSYVPYDRDNKLSLLIWIVFFFNIPFLTPYIIIRRKLKSKRKKKYNKIINKST